MGNQARPATRAERRRLHAAGYDLPNDLATELLPDGSVRWLRLHKRGTCDCLDPSCPRPSRARHTRPRGLRSVEDD